MFGLQTSPKQTRCFEQVFCAECQGLNVEEERREASTQLGTPRMGTRTNPPLGARSDQLT